MECSDKLGKKAVWIGRGISALAMFPFVMSAFMKVSGSPEMNQGMEHLGLPITLIPLLATLEIASMLLYIIPKTAVLGAILLTGYLGGAICTHLRIGEPVFVQITLGVLIWLGPFLREPRLRQILPLRDCGSC